MSIVKKMYNEYVIVKRDEAKKETESGLLLAESAVEHPYTGVVVATFNEEQVAIGARVVYQRGAGSPVEIDGVIYVVLRKVDLFCEL
jgi:co-chaperonin GroES (HSP10)